MSSTTFTISAAPDTDIWRKPPTHDVFNAPTGSPPGTNSTYGPLPSFISAHASFSFAWKEQYDQGGLLLSFRQRSSSAPWSIPAKWIKTGIEFYNGQPMLSTVACDRWADWSVTPLTTAPSKQHDTRTDETETETETDAKKTWTTLLIQKEGDENGVSLWVYHVLANGDKVPLREITWVYGDADPGQWDLEVLAMAARPAKTTTSSLKVEVKDMEVKWAT
ncbi:hypothetical protein B0T17DRAFT_482064 [Bombardia bombarda]|uniref:Uncharacterized protein n=1 Tax=Bombardia bombarda TaxID=252184 RepID=A0AA40CFK6_9PEZI|nr:hypothetical protein B0T17DRAFT_482064 [Bombardia bombarda]